MIAEDGRSDNDLSVLRSSAPHIGAHQVVKCRGEFERAREKGEKGSAQEDVPFLPSGAKAAKA